MFGLFRKKDASPAITDKVVIGESAKWDALLDAWDKNKNSVLVFWFEESLRQAEDYFRNKTGDPVPLLLVREVLSPQRAGRELLFAEHYPLRSKEEELYRALDLEKVTVYSSLREPLFRQFGGEKIIQLMQQLGMKEDEVIGHSMISKAIRQAQEKIEQQTPIDLSARSQEDWIRNNYKP
ncbi:MAG: hypothetical protein HYZ15_01460 [Sphingobacteriales bacterium]|nr:hypothetical protein [Sphingobacteriales bacterium]